MVIIGDVALGSTNALEDAIKMNSGQIGCPTKIGEFKGIRSSNCK